jgi:hypothetical protein
MTANTGVGVGFIFLLFPELPHNLGSLNWFRLRRPFTSKNPAEKSLEKPPSGNPLDTNPDDSEKV